MPLLAVKKRSPYNINELTHHGAWSGEAVAFCPQCKALQTVWISDDKLVPTRKFTQEGKDIYHDCGSSHFHHRPGRHCAICGIRPRGDTASRL